MHLTTNLVGCDPWDVRVGHEVTVLFEQHEDVWLPLFEPTGSVDPVDRVAPPERPVPRPPLGSERFEHRAVLSGIGRSKIGRRLMVDPLSLTIDACLEAVADAGLTLDDVDGLSTYPGAVGLGMSEGGPTAVEEALRIHPTWINGGGDLPGPGGAVIAAAMAVASGLCRHVLCFRTVWESTYATLAARRPGGAGGRGTGSRARSRVARAFGAMSAANWIGMNANQYMHRYGAPREMLGLDRGQRTDERRAQPGGHLSGAHDDGRLLVRTPITSPFGLYDCDVPCDGSIAVIVSDASVAGDLPRPAVRIEAVGTQILERVSWDQGTLTHEPQVLGQAAHLWTRTDVRPSEVDLALVYDGFTFNAISWIEGLGFCGFGESWDCLDGGRRIALDGELPVNPHGGQLSEGRTHGFGFVYEAVLHCDARPASVRSLPPRQRWSPPVVAPPRACCSSREPGHDSDGRAAQRPPLPPPRKGTFVTQPNPQTARKENDVPTTPPLTSEKPSGPRSRKGVKTRSRLVTAAKEIFERDGFLDARISDIAERAGLSHGSFYHYFESKEEVFPRGRGRGRRAAERSAAQRHPRPDVVGHSVRADPRSDPPPPGELPRRGSDHGCDRAGLALRRAVQRDTCRAASPLHRPDRGLHPSPAASWARRPTTQSGHRRRRPRGNDLPVPRDVVRAGFSRL